MWPIYWEHFRLKPWSSYKLSPIYAIQSLSLIFANFYGYEQKFMNCDLVNSWIVNCFWPNFQWFISTKIGLIDVKGMDKCQPTYISSLALKWPLLVQHNSSTLIPPQKIKPIFHTTPPQQILNTCHINPVMIKIKNTAD